MESLMPRYLPSLMGEGRVIDLRAEQFDNLPRACQEAFSGNCGSLLCLGEDGREINADNVEIYDGMGNLILALRVKGAFTQH